MSKTYETLTSAGASAPWLTLVHAMTQDRRVFSAQIEAFQKHYQILLIDLPGHGLATGIAGPYGHFEMMAHVRSVLDEVEIGPCHFWATHTGTAVGLLLAINEPERFKTLILEGAVISGFPMPYVADTLARASETARAHGIEAALRDVFYEADWYQVMRDNPAACRAAAHWNILKDFAGAPWTDNLAPAPVTVSVAELAALSIPTLIYNGEHDLEDFVSVAEHLAKMLPHVERAVIPKAGGFPAWEFPEQVNGCVDDFLSRHPG